MDDVIRFVKQHKYQIKKYGKKLFLWWKKNQNKQQQQQQGGYGGQQQGGYGGQQQSGYGGQHQQQQQGGYGGAAGYAGAASGLGYASHPGGYDQPPPQGQYGHPQQVQHGQSSIKPHHPNYNDNAVNSKNQRYMQLRSDARREGDLMAKCFDQSHAAYGRGDGGKAKELSNEGHQHKQRMEQLNKEASDWIYQANNEDSGPDEVDLHGLYTAEAITRTEQEIGMRQRRGDQTVRIIVGKGIHSKDHVAHIKPAIEDLMRKYQLQAHLDPKNSGVLVVDLTGKGGGAFSSDAGGFTRGLAQQASGNDEQCVVM
ncbi:unnamed protein product [Parajaminaea phylloscopi]